MVINQENSAGASVTKDPKSAAEAIDEHVGRKLRSARKIAGISQGALGAECGLSFQQIQKFEAGAIRISAGRLMQLANILGIPIGFFFDGISADGASKSLFDQRIFDLTDFSEAKSHCIRLIAVAEDADIAPLRDVLERLMLKRSDAG